MRADERVCEITGYTEGELRALCVQELTHPDDVEGVVAKAQGLLAGEVPASRFDMRLVRKDGHALWVTAEMDIERTPASDPVCFRLTVEPRPAESLSERPSPPGLQGASSVRGPAPGGAAYDARRMAALRHVDLLDTPPEPGFDRITALVRWLFDVPVALFTLVDKDRQFFKSQQGFPEPGCSLRETPLSYSFCQYVVASGAVAYLGVLVRHPSGAVLGVLCAFDHAPHSWTEGEVDTLRALADSVECEVALRVECVNREWSEMEAREARRHAEAVAVAAE